MSPDEKKPIGEEEKLRSFEDDLKDAELKQKKRLEKAIFADYQRQQVRGLIRSLPILASIVALIATLGVAISTLRSARADKELEIQARFASERHLEEIRRQLAQERDIARQHIAVVEDERDELQDRLKKLQGNIVRRQNYATLSPSDRDLINNIRNDEEKLQVRLGKLEEALQTTPEKALSTVVIRERLDSLQDRTHCDIDNIHGEIGRLFVLTEWFIGIFFTIALGVLGLALNLRKPKA